MKNKKIWIFIGIIVLIVILNQIFGWSSYIGDIDNLSFLKAMVKKNLAVAVLLYIVFTVVGCVVLALPGVTFAILAGLLFGSVLGTICCSVATTVIKNKYLKKWLFDTSGKNELFILMITRLVPIFPYNLQNFAYGITDIKFSTYTIGSFLFMLPGTAMYTVGTAGLTNSENRVLYIGIAVLLAVIVVGVGFFLKKRYIGEDTNEE